MQPKKINKYEIVQRDASKPLVIVPKAKKYNYKSQELYLQMIENKEKVLKSKLNQDYVAAEISLEYDPTSQKRPRDDEDDQVLDPKRTKTENVFENRIKELNGAPPSFSDLKAEAERAQNEIDEQKQKILAQFARLKDMYRSIEMPNVSMSTDLGFMQNEYKKTFKRLNLDKKFERNKNLLKLLFMGLEYLGGKLFKLDLKNFAKYEIENLSKYDALLIELGHKHYIEDAPEKFGVEIRLIGMVLMQTVLFILLKKMNIMIDTSSSTPNPNAFTSLFSMFGNLISPTVGESSQPVATPNQANTQPNTSNVQPKETKTEKESKMTGPKD